MATFKEMVSIKERVLMLLTKQPDTRDSDDVLIARYWYYEHKDVIKEGISAEDFLKMFSEGKATSPESIRRVRQKLQESHLQLRGHSYKARKKEAVIVSDNIEKL